MPTFNDISDGPLVSLVRVSPVYPAKALANQTEGYVIVEFDVTDRGQVTNVVTVDSSNEVFNKAAIKAAERFKFKP
ncbi:MAG: energy transducer TonB, partial [Woeseiaceae bacterium]|nr:energy transducer TonB [Woeseiaceae bacterium]